MKRTLIVFSLAFFSMLSVGCSGPLFRTYRDVKAQEFAAKYDRPWSLIEEYKYSGVRWGHHVLDYYAANHRTIPYYQYSLRTPVNELPENFPDHEQRKGMLDM